MDTGAVFDWNEIDRRGPVLHEPSIHLNATRANVKSSRRATPQSREIVQCQTLRSTVRCGSGVRRYGARVRDTDPHRPRWERAFVLAAIVLVLVAGRDPATAGSVTHDWLAAASPIAIRGERGAAQQLLVQLAAAPAAVEVALARALTAGVVGDRDVLVEVANSTSPLVRAAAAAELAEIDGTRDVAAAAWQRVIDLDRPGRVRTAALVHLARARAELGDVAGSVRICAAAMRPARYDAAWAAGIGACAALYSTRSAPLR